MKILAIFLSFLLSTIFNPKEDTGDLKIKVSGIKEFKGLIGVMIFNQKDGFPTTKEKAYLSQEVMVKEGVVFLEFKDLPKGKYAISLIHDVNGNKDLDKNIFGVPTEPFGFSNNKSILFGLPKFEEAALDLQSDYLESEIKLIDLF